MLSVQLCLLLCVLCLQTAMNVSGEGQGLKCYNCFKPRGDHSECTSGDIKECGGGAYSCSTYLGEQGTTRACEPGNKAKLETDCSVNIKTGKIVSCYVCDEHIQYKPDFACNGRSLNGGGNNGNQLVPGRLTHGMIGLIISIMGLYRTRPLNNA